MIRLFPRVISYLFKLTFDMLEILLEGTDFYG